MHASPSALAEMMIWNPMASMIELLDAGHLAAAEYLCAVDRLVERTMPQQRVQNVEHRMHLVSPDPVSSDTELLAR